MDKILWEIPVSILNQANHVFMWQTGVQLKARDKAKVDDIKEIAKFIGVEF